MTETEEMERKVVVRAILSALRNPLYFMCVPDREFIYETVKKFDITVVEILDAAYNKARNT